MLQLAHRAIALPSDLAHAVALHTSEAAERIGSATVGVARRVGIKRALIGLAVVGAIVGGSIALVRYLRARDEHAGADDDADDAAGDAGLEHDANGDATHRAHKQSRAKRKHANAARLSAETGAARRS